MLLFIAAHKMLRLTNSWTTVDVKHMIMGIFIVCSVSNWRPVVYDCRAH